MFTACADRRAQGGDGVGRVEVEHRQKVLMAEILAGVQPAAGQERIGGADRSRLPKGHFNIQLVQILQKRTGKKRRSVI